VSRAAQLLSGGVSGSVWRGKKRAASPPVAMEPLKDRERSNFARSFQQGWG